MIQKKIILKVLIATSLILPNLSNSHNGPVVRLTMHKKRGPDVHNCTVEYWTTCRELKWRIAREYGIRPKQVAAYALSGQELNLDKDTIIPGLNPCCPLQLIIHIRGYNRIDKQQERAIRRLYRS